MIGAPAAARAVRTRLSAIGVLVLLLVSLLPSTTDAARPHASALPAGVKRPDIIVLLLDDLPAMDDRLWERLPTIKRLFIDSGARFTDVVGNDPLCCPGRANLLTGQWSSHHGVYTNRAILFDPRETIATELHRAGYWTGIFGKYFNKTAGISDKKPDGWDRTFIFSGRYWNYRGWVDGVAHSYGAKSADYSTARIRAYSRMALAAAPPRRPRFLWLAPFATHVGADQQQVRLEPIQPAPQARDRGAPVCADTPDWSTAANAEDDLSDKPPFFGALTPMAEFPLVRHCESLLSVDRMLAATLALLAAQGRPEPMIILTADNGMGWGAHRWAQKQVPYATPVPFFIHWDALLGSAPVQVPTTLTNVDLAPTLCAIAGCEMGPFPNGFGVDGISFLPLLVDIGTVNRGAVHGQRRTVGSVRRTASGRILGASLGREVVFVEDAGRTQTNLPAWVGLRTTNESPIGRWAYTEWVTGEIELYDLSNGPCWTWQTGMTGDPCELTNRADDPDLADIRDALHATLAARDEAPLRLRGITR